MQGRWRARVTTCRMLNRSCQSCAAPRPIHADRTGLPSLCFAGAGLVRSSARKAVAGHSFALTEPARREGTSTNAAPKQQIRPVRWAQGYAAGDPGMGRSSRGCPRDRSRNATPRQAMKLAGAAQERIARLTRRAVLHASPWAPLWASIPDPCEQIRCSPAAYALLLRRHQQRKGSGIARRCLHGLQVACSDPDDQACRRGRAGSAVLVGSR